VRWKRPPVGSTVASFHGDETSGGWPMDKNSVIGAMLLFAYCVVVTIVFMHVGH
jgi:hypothetical protein